MYGVDRVASLHVELTRGEGDLREDEFGIEEDDLSLCLLPGSGE